MTRLTDKIGAFTAVPNSVIELLPEVGQDAFILYVYLTYRANEQGDCWPGYETIMRDTGLSRNKIARSIKVLVSRELISQDRRYSNSTVYTIRPISGLMTISSPESGPHSSQDGTTFVPNQDPNKNQLTRVKREDAPPPPPEPPDDFDAMNNEIGRLIGPFTPNTENILAISQMVAAGVTTEDLEAAVVYFRDKVNKPIRGPAHMLDSVLYNVKQRTQSKVNYTRRSRPKKQEHFVEEYGL